MPLRCVHRELAHLQEVFITHEQREEILSPTLTMGDADVFRQGTGLYHILNPPLDILTQVAPAACLDGSAGCHVTQAKGNRRRREGLSGPWPGFPKKQVVAWSERLQNVTPPNLGPFQPAPQPTRILKREQPLTNHIRSLERYAPPRSTPRHQRGEG